MDRTGDTAWALNALRDGVPPLWVAETIGWTDPAVRKLAQENGVKVTRDWAAVASKVRETHRLAILHYEFAPKATR